jgi:hypothetical protein
MQIRCPARGGSRYDCKVMDECDCDIDDDLRLAFDRQQTRKAAPGQPIRDWRPIVTTPQDMS